MLNHPIIPEFKPLRILLICLCFFLFQSQTETCDPILLSIIASKEWNEKREQEIQIFSTSLNELGRKWRNGESINKGELNRAKIQWLRIFEQYFTKPVNGITKEEWETALLGILKALKNLTKSLDPSNSEKIHHYILHIQNILISMYDTPMDLPFFERMRLIRELLVQIQKSRLRGLDQDLGRIRRKLRGIWQGVYPLLPQSHGKKFNPQKWISKLEEILNFSNKELESIGLVFIQELMETKWKEMDQPIQKGDKNEKTIRIWKPQANL